MLVRIILILIIVLYSSLGYAGLTPRCDRVNLCNSPATTTPIYNNSTGNCSNITIPGDQMTISYNPPTSSGTNLSPTGNNFKSVRKISFFGLKNTYSTSGIASTDHNTFANCNNTSNCAPKPIISDTGTPTVCFVKIVPGGNCPEGGTNQDEWTKVCGYVANSAFQSCNDGNSSSTSNAWNFNWNKARFGCLHLPMPPMPPPFNATLISQLSPIITQLSSADAVKTLGSSFIKPIVQISDGSNFVNLVYDYTNIDSSTNMPKLDCKVIADAKDNSVIHTTYCAEVPQDNPGQICVCPKGYCANEGVSDVEYIGCIPRPTPKQSGIKMIAFANKNPNSGIPQVTVKFLYSNNNGDLCQSSLAPSNSFCDKGTIIKNMPDNSFVQKWPSAYLVPYIDPAYNHSYTFNSSIYDLNGNMAVLQSAPYKPRGELPSSQKFYQEYYYVEDKANSSQYFKFDKISPDISQNYEINAFYDLQFKPYIANPQSPVILIQQGTPATSSCNMPKFRTFADTSIDDYNSGFVLPYVSYSAERALYNTVTNNQITEPVCSLVYNNYWSYCGSSQNSTPIPLDQSNNDGAYQIKTALCPGAFVMSDVQQKICFVPTNLNTWPELQAEVFGGSNYHDLCAKAPALANPAEASTGCKSERPSRANGYLKWSYANLGASQTSAVCDAGLGLEAKKYYYIALGTQVSNQKCISDCNSNALTPANTLSNMQCQAKCAAMLQEDYCKTKCGSSNCCSATDYANFSQNLQNVQGILNRVNGIADSESRNLLSPEIDAINAYIGQNINSSKNYVTLQTYPMQTFRNCQANGAIVRSGACVYKSDIADGCGNINVTGGILSDSRFLGYMNWESPTNFNVPSSKQIPDSHTSFSFKSAIVASPTTTTCNHVSSGTSTVNASRYCKVYYNGSKIIGKVWLDVDFSNSEVQKCVGNAYVN